MNNSQKSKKINVLIYTTTGFPYGMAAENFIRQVALGLKSLDVSVCIVRLLGENGRNSDSNDTGISVSDIFLKKKLFGLLSMINIIILPILIPFSLLNNKIKYAINTVIMYNVSFAYWGAPLIFWCKILGIKIYSFETERYLRKYFGKEWYKYPRWMTYELQYKCFDRYLDGKICLSDFLVKESLLYGLSKNKILKIPHFIDTDFFIKDSVKSNSNTFTIGFCGAIYSLNGIYILIEAFKLAVKKNPNFRLLLIGTTHLKEKDFFDEAIQEIKDHIIFPGMVSAKHVPDYLNKCDVLVNPREKSVLADSGFPTKIGEYLSTGKPVVTSQTGDLSDYFQDKEDIFFFESGDSKGLSDLLLFIYNNEKLAKRVAKNGLLSARKHLNYIESSKSLKNFLIN